MTTTKQEKLNIYPFSRLVSESVLKEKALVEKSAGVFSFKGVAWELKF